MAIGKRQQNKLHKWWTDHAASEADGMIAKLDEYGTGDLHEIGERLAALIDRDVTQQQAYELGVMFYLIGKMQRVITAAELQRDASDDTWHDIAVYAKMVLAARAKAMPQQ
jgi:hypothetical protein